jgi:hypothetical protein
MFASAPATRTEGAHLRIAITKVTCATEALARFASHDVDDDRRHAALDRFGVSDWDFLRVHAAVSAENVAVDCRGVGLSLQQDRGCDCGDAARRRDLGDAGHLCRRVSFGVLDLESSGGTAFAFSPISAARLRALACFFTRCVAYILACLRRFVVRRDPLGGNHLCFDAVADQSSPNTREKRLMVERVVSTRWQRCSFAA